MVKVNKIGGLEMKEQTSYGNLTFAEGTEWLEDNLKTGMYVRYTRGMINGNVPPRIARITDCEDNELIKIDNGQVILRSDVIKAGHKLIDLIEVGDYVNGLEVMSISYFKDGRRYIEFDDGKYLCKNYQIESIVTKAQFESIKYEVKK